MAALNKALLPLSSRSKDKDQPIIFSPSFINSPWLKCEPDNKKNQKNKKAELMR